MGWASKRKGARVALLGEDGKDTAPELPKVEITYRPDGNLGIVGPGDIRLTLRMLHEATDLVQANLAANIATSKLAAASVAKPNLRDVLAFSKMNQ